MKTPVLLIIFLAVSTVFAAPPVIAHGSDVPMHGGVVQIEQEMEFELVREEKSVSLYLREHGKAYLTKEVTGDIVVLANGKKSDAQLVAAGENKMTADIVIPEGAKVLVKVKESGHHGVTVRFSF
ncbi:hypothetical protein PALB_18110 [Pseudoalteromonas luteoviolacea B = ATCC 29581]|nr:hypothetical protein PALB_18110 [Pseudoalteromonas luteoviolacea B = ATCC 29581]